MQVIYTAQSKRYFYCRDAICELVARRGAVPLNPFRVFGYFLGDRVERDVVRRGNFELLARADAMWVFGAELADGVLAEVAFAHERGLPIRYFSVATRASEMEELAPEDLRFEAELLEGPWSEAELREVVAGLRPFVRPGLPAGV